MEKKYKRLDFRLVSKILARKGIRIFSPSGEVIYILPKAGKVNYQDLLKEMIK